MMSVLINKIKYELKLRKIHTIDNQLISYTKEMKRIEIEKQRYTNPDLDDFFKRINEYTRVNGRRSTPYQQELVSFSNYIKHSTKNKPKDKKAVILIGLPGSGKSTSINQIDINYNDFIVVDSDTFKSGVKDTETDNWVFPPLQDEYLKGIDVENIHDVSSKLAKLTLIKLIESGYNIVIPKIGDSIRSLKKLLLKLNENNYHIQVIFVHVSISTSLKRNLSRFLDPKNSVYPRIIHPDLIFKVGYRPLYNFFKVEFKCKWDIVILFNNDKTKLMKPYSNTRKNV